MIDVGDAAQTAWEQVKANYGGLIYLDDGRCAGWFEVPGNGQGGNRWTTRGSTVVSPVVATPGSVCQYADQINNGRYAQIELTISNKGRDMLVRGDRPISVKPAQLTTPKGIVTLKSPWSTRARVAVRKAVTFSPGPRVTEFSPLAGLPNQYRSR